jgi:hypothetical protein
LDIIEAIPWISVSIRRFQLRILLEQANSCLTPQSPPGSVPTSEKLGEHNRGDSGYVGFLPEPLLNSEALILEDVISCWCYHVVTIKRHLVLRTLLYIPNQMKMPKTQRPSMSLGRGKLKQIFKGRMRCGWSSGCLFKTENAGVQREAGSIKHNFCAAELLPLLKYPMKTVPLSDSPQFR